MLQKTIVFILFFLSSAILTAQPIDNTTVFRSINNTNYIRFYYDNDFFTATDQYYSQGINLEWVHPALKKFPLSRLLIHKKNNPVKYGLAIEHLAYTPTSIRHLEIIYGDRPFSASLTLKTFAITLDTVHRSRLSSTLNIGILGTAASGEWMQKTIHRNLNNIEPLGWNHQIKNDVIINYDVAYEKLLIAYKQLFSLSAYSQIEAGSLHDKASAGMVIMFGHFDNPFIHFNDGTSSKKIQIQFYTKPTLNAVVYDATLQGGIFNHKSPYTISTKDITRITFEDEAGITFQYHLIYLEYFQHFITKEFNSGNYHRWGGIRIGVAL